MVPFDTVLLLHVLFHLFCYILIFFFSLHFSLGSFYWHVFKVIDYFLKYIKTIDEPNVYFHHFVRKEALGVFHNDYSSTPLARVWGYFSGSLP